MQKAFFSFDANEYAPGTALLGGVRPGSTGRATRWWESAGRARPRVAPGPRVPRGLAGVAGIDPLDWPRPFERWNRFVADGWDRDYGRRGGAPTTGSTVTPSAPHPTSDHRAGAVHLPVYIGSVWDQGRPRSTGTAGSSTSTTRPIPGLYGPATVVAARPAPPTTEAGHRIGMGLVWGHLAGAHAASYVTARHRRPLVTRLPRRHTFPVAEQRRQMYALMA